MAGEVTLRSAVESDLDELVPVAGSRARAAARLSAAAPGDETLVVAEIAGVIAGAVSVRWVRGCDPPNPWLYGLHVDAQCRRRGVGSVLVLAAEKIARSRKAAAMSLDVDRDEVHLLEYYRRMGYHPVTQHLHEWRTLDPDTGAVIATGASETWILRHKL